MDSGTKGNFIGHHMAEWHQTPLLPLSKSLPIHTIDGGPIGVGTVKHCTLTLIRHISILHKETTGFLGHIYNCSPHCTVHAMDGASWASHLMGWGEILQWSPYCLEHCLQHPHLCLASNLVESPETAEQVQIPREYHTLMEFFVQQKESQ